MKRLISISLLLTFVLCGAAAANPAPSPTGAWRDGALPSPAARLADAAPETAPIAFVRFCILNEDQCRGFERATRLRLDETVWAEILDVNAAVNRRIRPDAAKGAFDWSLEATRGNCNDYAVQKRQALIELGYPASALSLTAAVTPWGEGHLVLTLRTDRGDFVLDNLRQAVLAAPRAGYRYLKRQSISDPHLWVAVSGFAPAPVLASVRREPARVAAPLAGRIPARTARVAALDTILRFDDGFAAMALTRGAYRMPTADAAFGSLPAEWVAIADLRVASQMAAHAPTTLLF